LPTARSYGGIFSIEAPSSDDSSLCQGDAKLANAEAQAGSQGRILMHHGAFCSFLMEAKADGLVSWQPAHSPRLVLDQFACLPKPMQRGTARNQSSATSSLITSTCRRYAGFPASVCSSFALVFFQEHLCLPAPCILEAVLTLVLIFPPEMLYIGSWQAGPGETLQK
jgi:hypothetical protein